MPHIADGLSLIASFVGLGKIFYSKILLNPRAKESIDEDVFLRYVRLVSMD